VRKTLIFSFSVFLLIIGFCLLTIGTIIDKVQGFQQVAGPIIINATPGITKSFSWGLLAGDNETSLLKIYADGNGSEFLSYPEIFKLDPGKINYLVGNVTIPATQDIGITFTPIIHSTISENETENSGGNDVNVELSKLLTISIGGNKTSPSNPQQGNATTNDIGANLDNANLDNASKDYLTFEDSKFGLKLSYPSNWSLKQGSTDNPLLEIISVLSPINDNDSSFRIGIRSTDAGIMNVKEYANNTIGEYEHEIPGFQTILYNPDSALSGNPAYQIEGSYTYNNSGKQYMTETGVLFNNKIYIFQYNAADSKSASYLPAVRAMVESIEFIPGQQSPELTSEMGSSSNLSRSIASSFESSAGQSMQSCQDISALNATASGFESDPKDYNPPPDAVDGDINTWWAIKGIPSWLQIELDKTTTICAVEIAWNKGNERTYEFTISGASDDGDFTELFSGKSSGKKQSFERYEINSSPTDIKSIKLDFSGSSSEKGWVSIKEVKVIGR
jgi:hypothetical protein